MEFHEKLQELRKNKGLTQEELAEVLYVSRTAISKWESGRGYPSIDSLKQISAYFSITIDDLLSGDELLSLAERENKGNLQKLCGMLSGITDLLAFLLIVLPLYPQEIDGYVYAVNLLAYGQATSRSLLLYWAIFAALVAIGTIKVVLAKRTQTTYSKVANDISMVLSVVAVIYLALSREAYAATLVFLLLVIKAMLMVKHCDIMKAT